ncbi:MAG: flavin reductase family protein [Candidatus Brocadia sp.]|nr:flavin reductase family protein [Candidatus Brocadia sp.]
MKKSLGAKTIVYPTPVFIVGTYDKSGKPNAMNVAWGGLCCSSPPCVAISVRKATYTYGNIVERKAFTINIPSEAYVKEADYFGVASGAKADKFSVTKLTPVKSDLVDAPYIREFPLILECKLTHTLEIGLHTQFIGEIMDVKAEESMFGDSGTIDIEKLRPFLYAPEVRAYYGIGKCLGKAFSIGKQMNTSDEDKATGS